jgi:hypothetical protein
MTTPEQETIQEPEVALLYQISFDRIAELNRSAIAMVADRRPPRAPSRANPDSELTDPKKLVDEIATHCADDENFIRTEMPIQEIVFRLLLARRNTPTLLSDLHYELTEKWSTPVRPINLSEAGLGRILDSDTYYGFART